MRLASSRTLRGRDAANVDSADVRVSLDALIANTSTEGYRVQGGEGGQVEVAHKGQTGAGSANDVRRHSSIRSPLTTPPQILRDLAARAAVLCGHLRLWRR